MTIQVPEGWRLVPLEPTDEMDDAAEIAETRHYFADPQLSYGAAYRAMVAAAPDYK